MFDKLKKFIRLYISCFNRRDSNLWVFGGWFGEKFADNTKYLFETASKDPSIHAIWVSSNDKVIKEIRDNGFEAYQMHSKEAICLQKKAKYFFSCTGFLDYAWEYSGNAILIELWHGIPLKKVMWDDKTTKRNRNSLLYNTVECLRSLPRRNEYIIATSDVIKNIYIGCFRKKSNHVLIYGQPRNDVFYFGKSALKEKFGGGKKIIMYMPTHRNQGHTSINCEKILDLNKLNEFCKEQNILFLIKKHFYHREETENLDAFPFIIDITKCDFDVQELLFAADILITDYSSCYFDYLLLDRPVIFYGFDYNNYILNDREMYFSYEEVTPGRHVYSFSELMDALRASVNGDDGYSDERKNIRDMFYDKKAQQIISNLLIRDIKNGFLLKKSN